jgi:Matrixin
MLHRIIATSAVLLVLSSLLGGCLGTEHLSTRTPERPAAPEAIASLREARPHYTSHVVATVKPEIFFLFVSDAFSVYERAQILRAVNEWNVALNGFIRFEIMAGKTLPKTQAQEYWFINPRPGGQIGASSMVLAATHFAPGVGGLVDVYLERIGRRDLGGVVMHELGHVLGLGHSGKPGLMAAHYHPTSQRCVDRSAVEALAARRKLPLARLNWCAET